MTAMILAALLAQTADTTVIEPSSKWMLDPVRRVCQLTRSFGEGPQATLIIRRAPLSSATAFHIVTTSVPIIRDYPLKGTLRDETTGREFFGTAQIGTLKSRPERQLTIYAVDQSFVGNLGSDAVLSFQVNGKAVAAVRPKDFQVALRALDRCEEDLLRQWGIDPASVASLKSLPEPANDPRTWVAVSDYPVSALISEAEGLSTVRYRVTVDGTVRSCTTAQSSGARSLDARTCDLLVRRARYRPAIGADGKPVEAWLAITVSWDILSGR